MSHVFPLRRTRPALLRLFGVFVLGGTFLWGASSCTPRPAYAESNCGTPDELISVVSAHPAYAANSLLTAAEAARGMSAVSDNAPKEVEIESGVLVLRTDGSLVFFIFLKAGNCGTLITRPGDAEKIMRAIKGHSARLSHITSKAAMIGGSCRDPFWPFA